MHNLAAPVTRLRQLLQCILLHLIDVLHTQHFLHMPADCLCCLPTVQPLCCWVPSGDDVPCVQPNDRLREVLQQGLLVMAKPTLPGDLVASDVREHTTQRNNNKNKRQLECDQPDCACPQAQFIGNNGNLHTSASREHNRNKA